jgi:hypothetical protein
MWPSYDERAAPPRRTAISFGAYCLERIRSCLNIAGVAQEFLHSVGVNALVMRPILHRRPRIVRSSALRKSAFSLLKAISMGSRRTSKVGVQLSQCLD